MNQELRVKNALQFFVGKRKAPVYRKALCPQTIVFRRSDLNSKVKGICGGVALTSKFSIQGALRSQAWQAKIVFTNYRTL